MKYLNYNTLVHFVSDAVFMVIMLFLFGIFYAFTNDLMYSILSLSFAYGFGNIDTHENDETYTLKELFT